MNPSQNELTIVRCKTCHYSLEGLTEHRCPECGNAFDPNNPDSFEIDGEAKRWSWRKRCLGVLSSYIVAFALIWFLVLPSLADPRGLPRGGQVMRGALMSIFCGPLPFIIIGCLAADLRSRPFTSVFDDDEAI